MAWYRSRYSDYGHWPRYVPVSERRAKAAAHAKKLAKKGHEVQPVEIAGREIARTFWGKAWCENLERYSDYENRLPRGRSYVRNGSVVDLRIEPGLIEAIVSGSRIYNVAIRIKPLEPARWKALRGRCAGRIDSAVELLKGNFSGDVMAVMTEKGQGLFPAPKEIEIKCSCPDYAGLCKHAAATLYGVGARLDERPELLFKLRKVDETDLVAQAGGAKVLARRGGRGKTRKLDEAALSGVFGIEIEAQSKPTRGKAQAVKKKAEKKQAGATRRTAKKRKKRK